MATPFPTNGNGSIRGFGLRLSNGLCTVTSNMITGRGSLANLVDGVDSVHDLRPWTYTSWAPQVLYGETAGDGVRFARNDGLSSIGGNQGRWIQWDFGEPTSVGLMRFRCTTDADFGIWQLYVSQDGENFTAEGNPMHLGGPNVGGVEGEYDTRENLQVPLGAPYMVTYGNGFTAMPNRIYESDADPQIYFINTKFYRYFRLEGITTFIPSYPWEGAGGLPASDIWCLDLTSSDIPGLVWQDPYTIELDPEEGYPVGDLVPPVPGGTPSYIIDPPDFGTTPGPGPGSNWPPAGNGDWAGTVPGFVPPKSAYRSPFSRGSRSTTGNGNSLVAAVPETTEPPHEYGPIASAFDNNFGAGAGNGAYYAESAPGFYHQLTFSEPIIVTALKLVNDGAGNLDYWKLRGYDDTVGDYIDLSTDHLVVFPVSSNGPFGREFEIKADLATTKTTLYRLTRGGDNPVGANGRLATEINVKVAGSFLEGGDRRTGADTIAITSTFVMRYSSTVPATPEQLAFLIDGQYETYNGGGNGLDGTGIDYNGGVNFTDDQDVDSYFQFAFVRQVRVKWATVHISGNPASSYEVLASGVPTRWGTWKWMASADNVTYVDVGEPFYLTPDADDPILDGGNDDPTYYGFWRLVKVSGTIITTAEWQEITFALDDLGDPTPITFVAGFNDDEGMVISAPTVSEPNVPFSAVFRDDATLTATPTLHYQKLIQGNFVDETEFDVFSELSPSLIVQVSNYQTGR